MGTAHHVGTFDMIVGGNAQPATAAVADIVVAATASFYHPPALCSQLFRSCAFRIMLLDFEVQRCTRRCAATDRALEPGDDCYSVLEVQGADVIRKDFCREAWSGVPENAFGWWKSRVPEPTAKKIKLAPNDVLLELFDQLADNRSKQDLRYVLALLLVRRRVLRVDVTDDQSHADSTRRPT